MIEAKPLAKLDGLSRQDWVQRRASTAMIAIVNRGVSAVWLMEKLESAELERAVRADRSAGGKRQSD